MRRLEEFAPEYSQEWFRGTMDRINRKLEIYSVQMMRPDESQILHNPERDPAGMRNFDLPRGEAIGYVALCDAVEPWEIDHLRQFPSCPLKACSFSPVAPQNSGVTSVRL